jgi:uncharacterized protein GlcG (DUF336 family)
MGCRSLELAGKPVGVSMCDAFGLLLVLSRMDAMLVCSIQLTQQYAHTSPDGCEHRHFLERLRPEEPARASLS